MAGIFRLRQQINGGLLLYMKTASSVFHRNRSTSNSSDNWNPTTAESIRKMIKETRHSLDLQHSKNQCASVIDDLTEFFNDVKEKINALKKKLGEEKLRRQELELKIFHDPEKGTLRNAFVKIRVIERISDLTWRYLRDENISRTTANELFNRERAHEYLMLVLERSEKALAEELRQKLKLAGITNAQFSKAIASVLFRLEEEPDFVSFVDNLIRREEIIKILDHLKLDPTSYQCVKILLSLEEHDCVNTKLWNI